MNEPLLLHIPTGADLQATISSFQSSLSSQTPDERGAASSLIVLVPAALVPRFNATLPAVPSHKLRQAAAYAIEDRLIGDVESQHLTIIQSQAVSDGRLEVEVAAIERDWLNTLLAALNAAGLKPSALHADADCIGSKPGDVLLWIDGADAHWITPRGLRRTWPVDALAEALDWSLGSTPSGTVGLRVYASETDLQKYASVIDELRGKVVSVQLHAVAQPLDWLSRGIGITQAANLLHSEFTQRATETERWQRWRWPLRLAGLVIAVFMAQLVTDVITTTSRARVIEERVATQAASLLPPASDIQNVVPLLERQLIAVTSRSRPSPTLDTLNSLVNESGTMPLALDAIALQPGRATLQLTNASNADLAPWRATWSAAGWQVTDRNDPQGTIVIELVRP